MDYRMAKRGDAALILSFIRELARYERLEDKVSATEELLDRQLFTDRAAEVIFPLVDGREAGFALFFHNFSTFQGRAGLYLEDLYIRPEYRGRGLGHGVFELLQKIARERGYGRVEWVCLNDNAPAIGFYRSLGAQPMNEWTTWRISLEG